MNNLHYVNLEIKNFQEYEGKIIGYGAYYNNIDRVNDIILPGTFKISVEEHRMGKKSVPLLEEHKSDLIWLNNIQNLAEEENGLKIEAIIPEEKKPEFKNITTKKGLSIGYIVKKSHNILQSGKSVRVITEADLVEISVVDNPANPKATAEFKSYDAKEFKTKIDSLFEERKSISSLQAGIEVFLKENGDDFTNGVITHSQRGYFAEKVINSILELKNVEKNQIQVPVGTDNQKENKSSSLESPHSSKAKFIFDKEQLKQLIK